jgi:hypothetical protein
VIGVVVRPWLHPGAGTSVVLLLVSTLTGFYVFLSGMPGASEKTRQVKVLNANWNAGRDGDDGRFEVMIITDDDQQYTVSPSPASMTALMALAQANTILLGLHQSSADCREHRWHMDRSYRAEQSHRRYG